MEKSSALDALISQNEDLQARLNINLKKQESLEVLLERSQSQLRKFEEDHLSFQDRLDLLREKEEILRAKLQDKDELEIKYHKLVELQNRTEILLGRYKKYAEKMQTQIRPYIRNLREYSQGQSHRIAELETIASNREQYIKKLLQDLEVKADSYHAAQMFYEENQNLLSGQWRSEKESYIIQIEGLKGLNQELQIKAERAQSLIAREDELENLLIAQARAQKETEALKADESRTIEKELETTRAKLGELSKYIQFKDMEYDAQKSQIDILKLKLDAADQQVQSLRLLWRDKSQSNNNDEASSEMGKVEKLGPEILGQLPDLNVI